MSDKKRADLAGTERAHTTKHALYATLVTGLTGISFAIYASLAGTNHVTVALPFAFAGWLASRGGGRQS